MWNDVLWRLTLFELQLNSVKYAWSLNVNLNVRINPNLKYEIFVLAFFHLTFLSRKNTFSALRPTYNDDDDDDDDDNNLSMHVNSIIICIY